MRILKRLSTVAVAGALATAGLAAATSGPAAAADNSPCSSYQYYRDGHWVQYCPLWRANVPVYASPDNGNSSSVVGYLYDGGSANWFVGDSLRSTYTYGSYQNYWWAYTEADNGHWGWVPEVFFSGGDDFEGDAGLYICNTANNFCY